MGEHAGDFGGETVFFDAVDVGEGKVDLFVVAVEVGLCWFWFGLVVC